MKAYLFNPENGLYEGETFEQAAMLDTDDGITPISPPDYEQGQVPVFDRQTNTWTVIPLNVARRFLAIGSASTGEKQP